MCATIYVNKIEGDMSMSKYVEKTTHSTPIYSGKIIQVHVDDVVLANGIKAKREIVKHPGAVGIIPITKDKKIIFVKQYRKPLEKELLEIPAGRLEKDEAPDITAVRELEEETGYTTSSVSLITSFYTSPGFADELIYLYMTTDLSLVDHPVEGDEHGQIELVELTLDEAVQYVEEQKIHDAKTNYAILYLQSLEWMKT